MIHETIHTLLNLVEENNYPLQAPQGVAAPYVVYTSLNITPNNTKSGPSNADIYDLVIDYYHSDILAARTLAEAARTEIDYYSGGNITSITFRGRAEDFEFTPELVQIRDEYTVRLKR